MPDIALHTIEPTQGSAGHAPIILDDDERVPSRVDILRSRKVHKRVRLNVGGVRHEVMWTMLQQVLKKIEIYFYIAVRKAITNR